MNPEDLALLGEAYNPARITVSPIGGPAGGVTGGLEGLAGVGNVGDLAGDAVGGGSPFGLLGLAGGGVLGLLDAIFGPSPTTWSPEALALRQQIAGTGQPTPMVGGTPARSGGAIDAAAITNLINSALGISPAGAGEVSPAQELLNTQAGANVKDPRNLTDMDIISSSKPLTTTPLTTTTPAGVPMQGDATTLLPGRSGGAYNPLRLTVSPATGGAITAPGTSAAAAANAANPNAVSALPTPSSAAEIVDINKMKDLEAIQRLTGTGPANIVTLPTAAAPAAAPAGSAASDFWKEYGPWLGLAAGAGGLAYGLYNQKNAQADQQATAANLNRVAGNVQSSVIDPTSTALAVNELIAKSGAASDKDISLANPFLDVFNTGKLPPALQTWYDLQLADANAASKSRFANMGIGNSTMLDEVLASNAQRNLASKGGALTDLYNLGLKTQQQGLNITNDMVRNILTGSSVETGALTGAGGLYNQIAKDQIAADKDLVDAIAKLATQMGKAAAT